MSPQDHDPGTSSSVNSRAKNIVILSDGTGQEGGEGPPTNVYKLYQMLLDRHPEQIAYYDRGLGTGWRRLTGKAFGAGISRNLLDCYRFLFDHYQSGDRIYLYGFSRGATTVRSLSGFLHLFGILPQARPELIEKAYKIYKKRDPETRKRLADEFVAKHRTIWCKVRVLGVWDTVAALGTPWKSASAVLDQIRWFRHQFHDLRLSESVETGLHALSIDDERKTFHPTLWDTQVRPGQEVEQVWFSGMHTDVGGGYDQHALSDIALEWMIQNSTERGLRIYERHKVLIHPDADGYMHNSRKGFIGGLFSRKTRAWNHATHGDPVVHESVKKRVKNNANTASPPYAPWILEGAHTVEPWERNTPWWSAGDDA